MSETARKLSPMRQLGKSKKRTALKQLPPARAELLRGDVDEILVHEFATSFNLTNYSLTRILFSCAIFPCVVHDSAEVNNNGN